MDSRSLPAFNPDFAAPYDWAAMYRAAGLQVVPSHMPGEHQNWKRPALANWKTLQEDMVPDATFERWYAAGCEHARRQNMGIITGRSSGNVFVIDLDEYKSSSALNWWLGVMAEHNNGMDLETCQQVTGGGGRQLFFRAPPGWHTPTNKTPIGVDIRGQGGFAVLPPSKHASGQDYAWREGCAPWEMEIALAPDWLLDAVNDLVQRYGGDQAPRSAENCRENTPSPLTDFDAFGSRVDGRDHYMRDLVWAAVVNWYRECPIPPTEAESQARMRETWQTYERKTKTRLPGDNLAGLEREGRGPTMFAEKWRRALSKWDTEVADDARRPLGEDVKRQDATVGGNSGQVNVPTGKLILSFSEFVAGFQPPDYLIDGIIQRGRLYSFTARTGHGKTAVAGYMSQAVARGADFHGHRTRQGSVLFLAGENPDDVRARSLVLADYHDFNAHVPIHFIPGVIDIAACLPQLQDAAAGISDLSLIIVDTAAAYFRGDDGNSNAQKGEYARLLRQLTFLPGKPACVVPCHPIKNAGKENLVPEGGGAFLNEVDGNLTLWSDAEKQATLHHDRAKWRGPEFEPMSFELRMAESPAVVDSNGECLPSVVAVPIGDMAVQMAQSNQESDENLVMKVVAASPRASMAQIAERVKRTKSQVQRIFGRLLDDKMIAKHRGGKYRLTEKGKKEIGIACDDGE